MAVSGSAVFLSTLLLEKNRWNGKGPSLLISDWLEPIGEAGFVGLDLWMTHLRLASRSEWDLIKDKAVESDLELAMISATIPTDSTDKSQRLREAILEACDYFRPDRLKFSLPEEIRNRAERGPLIEGLTFLRTWSQDVHRDIGMIYDIGTGEVGMDVIEKTQKIFNSDRFKIAIHPFMMSPKRFAQVLEVTGDFLGNLSIQAKSEAEWIPLKTAATEYREIISSIRNSNYKGTWTLEHTEGTGLPGENVDLLFDNAEIDLNFLTDALARVPKKSLK